MSTGLQQMPEEYGLGESLVDNAASTTAVDFGGTKLASSTSKNTIFYIAPSEMHRWNGASNMVPLPGKYTCI